MVYKLLGVPLSPYVAYAMSSLELLGADYELVPTLPHSNDADFVKASPFGKVPAFVDGDFSISDSTAIVVYADSKINSSGEKSLFGTTPETRAQVAFFEKYIQNVGNVVAGQPLGVQISDPENKEAMEKALESVQGVLQFLNDSVQDNGFFVGSGTTAADIAVFSHFTVYRLFGVVSPAKYPKLAKFLDQAGQVPALAKVKKLVDESAAAMFKKN